MSAIAATFSGGKTWAGGIVGVSAGPRGTIQTTAAGHDPATENITAVFVAEYTDPGGLTGRDQVVLRQNR